MHFAYQRRKCNRALTESCIKTAVPCHDRIVPVFGLQVADDFPQRPIGVYLCPFVSFFSRTIVQEEYLLSSCRCGMDHLTGKVVDLLVSVQPLQSVAVEYKDVQSVYFVDRGRKCEVGCSYVKMSFFSEVNAL